MAAISEAHAADHFYILVGLVIAITIFEICGQTCIRKYRENGRLQFIILGVFMYLTVVALLLHSYRFHGMGIVNLLWSCLSIILAIVVGHFVFKESFNHYMAIAIIFAFAAVFFANKAQSYEK